MEKKIEEELRLLEFGSWFLGLFGHVLGKKGTYKFLRQTLSFEDVKQYFLRLSYSWRLGAKCSIVFQDGFLRFCR